MLKKTTVQPEKEKGNANAHLAHLQAPTHKLMQYRKMYLAGLTDENSL